MMKKGLLAISIALVTIATGTVTPITMSRMEGVRS